MFVKKIFKHVWPQIMKYKWSFYLTFAFYGLRVFLISVLKAFYFKKIIDIISGPVFSRNAVASELIYLVVINILILLGDYACSRLGAWAIVYFQSNVMKRLYDSGALRLREFLTSFPWLSPLIGPHQN